MNYIILFATGFIQKLKMKQIRLILSSLLGGVYAIVGYLNIIPIYSNFFMKILLSIVMCYIAFNESEIKKLLKTLLLFYLSSFVIGGFALALLYLISPENIKIENGVLVGMYPMKVTLIAGILGFIIIQIAFKLNKMQIRKKDMIGKLEISVNHIKTEVKAYMDSGNLLKEPITKVPVVVVEKEKIKNISDIDLMGGDTSLKVRMIPFNSIGKQNGMLVGIKPDFIKIKFNEVEKTISNVVIGLYDKKISKDYSALIGLELLEGESDEDVRVIKQNVRKVHTKK